MPDPELDPEDAKLLTLARSVLARTGGAQGAAVRDRIGRTYVAGPVGLPSLRLSAVQAAVAAAVSSGADGLEAVVVVGLEPTDDDLATVRDLGGGCGVWVFEVDGTLRSTTST